MKSLVIIGAGGHGKVVADIAKLNGYENVKFLDDNVSGSVLNLSIVGKVEDAIKFKKDNDLFVAVGNNEVRCQLIKTLVEKGATLPVLIHPSAVIGSGVKMGCGSLVCANVVINAEAVLGNGVIVNTCSSVDHDCIIGDYSHVSVGAHLAGNVKIGSCTLIGAGATVINNVEVCKDTVIGAGAVVVKDIIDSGVYVGVPALRR